MSKNKQKSTPAYSQSVRMTMRLTLAAYDAVSRIQREHRVQMGKTIPKWRIIDEAIRHYAKEKGIQI